MDLSLLKKTIELLKIIRSDPHSFGDDSVIQRLNEVIQELEAENASGKSNINADKTLFLLGKVIEDLPFFTQLIETLVKKLSGE
jgi:hypothetical protein